MAAAAAAERLTIAVKIHTTAGADLQLPLPEPASVDDLRAAIAGRLEVHPLSFDLFAAGGEGPLAGSEHIVGVIGLPPSSAPVFMLQRLGIALTHVFDFDANGYMRWKGTQGGTQAYQNPQRRGGVSTHERQQQAP
jgi:hypothetical protein